jgi:hypothetical protein
MTTMLPEIVVRGSPASTRREKFSDALRPRVQRRRVYCEPVDRSR